MSKRYLHLVFVNPIYFKCDFCCKASVTFPERLAKVRRLSLGQGLRIGHANSAEVLCLEPPVASAHAHTIRRDEKLPDCRQQQTTEYFEVPSIRFDEI